jgi:hypothetical protein
MIWEKLHCRESHMWLFCMNRFGAGPTSTVTTGYFCAALWHAGAIHEFREGRYLDVEQTSGEGCSTGVLDSIESRALSFFSANAPCELRTAATRILTTIGRG